MVIKHFKLGITSGMLLAFVYPTLIDLLTFLPQFFASIMTVSICPYKCPKMSQKITITSTPKIKFIPLDPLPSSKWQFAFLSSPHSFYKCM